MFSLSVVDHVRLSFGHVVQSYMVQARAAERLTAIGWTAKVTVLVLLAVATGATIAALLTGRRPFLVTAVACVTVAFAAQALYTALDVEPRIHAHRASANRLWLIAERYRALLAEIRDGLVEREEIQRRRDDLLQQVNTAYEHALPASREAIDAARHADRTGSRAALTDDQIDRFLPESLRKRPDAVEAASPSHA